MLVRPSHERSVVMTTATGFRLTSRNKVGLVLATVLAATDVTGPVLAPLAAAVFLPQSFELAIVVGVIATLAVGLTTVVGLVLAWSKASRIGARVVAGARVASVVINAPIFLAQDLEAWIVLIGAAVVILNITTVILVLSRGHARRAPASLAAERLPG
jgi:hypothetical protein